MNRVRGKAECFALVLQLLICLIFKVLKQVERHGARLSGSISTGPGP